MVNKPQYTYKRREIWDADTIKMALDKCQDSKLYLAINLFFACSLRIGEVLGLTWDNIHISDAQIANDDVRLFVEKELQRAFLLLIDTLEQKDIIQIFPPLLAKAKTRIVLKKTKTESSIRKVRVSKTLAYILREYQKSQEELKHI